MIELHAPPAEVFVLPAPPMPPYVTRLQVAAGRDGVSVALHKALTDAGVTTRVEGDMTVADEPGEGAIWYGNHRGGVEPILLGGVFGRLGRSDFHFFGKPYALQARVLHGAGPEAWNTILPVYPSRMADPAARLRLRDRYWRWRLGSYMPTDEQIREMNNSSQQRATAVVAAGELALIFPTGHVGEALEKRWHHGLGRMTLELARRQSEAPLIPFQFDAFSTPQLTLRLLRRVLHLRAKPYEVVLRVAEPLKPAEVVQHVLDGFSADERAQAANGDDRVIICGITQFLRRRYVAQFGSPRDLARLDAETAATN